MLATWVKTSILSERAHWSQQPSDSKVWCLSAPTIYSHSKTPKFTRNQYRRPDGVYGNPYISFFVTNKLTGTLLFRFETKQLYRSRDWLFQSHLQNCRFICYFNASGYIILTLSQHCLKTVLQSQYCVNISSALCNHCLNIPTTLSWNGLNILPPSNLGWFKRNGCIKLFYIRDGCHAQWSFL